MFRIASRTHDYRSQTFIFKLSQISFDLCSFFTLNRSNKLKISRHTVTIIRKQLKKLACRETRGPVLTSQSFPVSCAVLYPAGSEISRFQTVKTRGRKIDVVIRTLCRFYQANKKKSVIYTLNSLL